MKEPAFRRQQWDGIRDPHIAPFNELVDRITSEDEFVPYVAPIYGGMHARLLAIFRDPGPATGREASGMLCLESNDNSAARHSKFLAHAGIDVKDLMVWNAYPWYIHGTQKRLTTPQIERGHRQLKEVINLLPNLAVIMTHGKDATKSWRQFRTKHPETRHRYTWIDTHHTSQVPFNAKGKGTPAQLAFENKLTSDFAKAAAALART